MRLHEKFSPGSLLIYIATLTLEVPVIALRLTVAYFIAVIILVLNGHPTVSAGAWSELALIPTGWSILALIWPGGSGWWWRQQSGGREPSQREWLAYEDAFTQLREQAPEPLPEPASWFVLDDHEPNAAVVGDTLMLSRGLLDGPHLPAVLAHELGHLGSPDGRVTAALNRLMIHPPIYDREPREREHHEHAPLEFNNDTLYIIAVTTYITVFCTKMLAKGCRGGLGLYLTRPLWGKYWREREYIADEYAASSGKPTSSPTSWKSTG
jgi:Zn-dependent protease with chaperone function